MTQQLRSVARPCFSKPARYAVARRIRRWSPEEDEVVANAVARGLSLDETHALLPHRQRGSVKDRFYQFRAPQDRDKPAAVADIDYQKDAWEGSAKLYEALVDAGFVFLPRKT